MNQPPTQTEPGLERALSHLQSVLIPGEILEAYAVQRRLFALRHRREIVAATSGRLISLARGLLGGFELKDLRWQDLDEVRLRVGVIAAELTVLVGQMSDLASQGQPGSRMLSLKGLRIAQAEAVYRICQAQQQAWREKRRVRDLEELRARAGGIQLNTAAAPAGGAASGGGSDALRRLQEAKQLLDNKLISDAEYEAIKAKILSAS